MDYNFHSMNRMVALLALCGTAAYAQSAGTITGTVVDSDGEAVANAQVQATNRSTKAVYKIAGSEMGITRWQRCRQTRTMSRSLLQDSTRTAKLM
jgi:hypothetical protein